MFWMHLFDWGDSLKATIESLVALRARHGINSGSKLTIQYASWDCYVANIDDK